MAGEDLISSAEIAGKIMKVLGKRKPEGFHYKLFLDEDNQKDLTPQRIEKWVAEVKNEFV